MFHKTQNIVSWNKTLLDFEIRIVVPCVANKRDLSCISINRYKLGNTESVVSELTQQEVLEQFVPRGYILKIQYRCIWIDTD